MYWWHRHLQGVYGIDFVLRKPPVKEVSTEWTLGAGPFPLNMTCLSHDGCAILNSVTEGNTFGMSKHVPLGERECVFLEHGSSIIMQIVYTLSLTEGIYLFWKGNLSVALQSQIRCFDTQRFGCVHMLDLPVLPGIINLNYVQTHNYTEVGPSRQRNEWFMNIMSKFDGEGPIKNNTRCTYGDDWELSLVQLNSLYNIVNVKQYFSIVDFIGTVGGAISMFFSIGGFVLVLMTWLTVKIRKRQENYNIESPVE